MTDTLSLPPSPRCADPERLANPFRLATLGRTGLLDGAPNAVLDRVARVATVALGVPVALVSLVDDRGQHFPGMAGLEGWAADARGTPLTHSFCQHVVAAEAPLVVDDAAAHPLVRDNLARRDLGVVAYLGVPLASPAGDTLGAMCAIDVEARRWTEAHVEALRELATLAMAEIALRETICALRESEARLGATEARLSRALTAASMGAWEWDLVADRAEVSAEWGPLLGLGRGEGAASMAAFLALVHPEDRVCVRAALDDALSGHSPYDVRFRVGGANGRVRVLHDTGTVERDAQGRPVRLAGVVRAVAGGLQAG